MKHLSQDDLILHYYGESGAGATEHIVKCPGCRANFEELSGTLSAVALPEPPPRGRDYSAEVWRRIKPKLNEPTMRVPWWAVPGRWAAVGGVAVLIAVAFMAGRYTNRPPAHSPLTPVEATNNAQLPQKLLAFALGDYLDRSEMLLVEVAHANRPEDFDVNAQRRYASELLATNRLYRQTAQSLGDTDTGALLDQIEPVLLQLEHTPERATETDIKQLQLEIDSGALLFKVRVVQVHLKTKAKSSRDSTGEDPGMQQGQLPIL